MGHSRGSSHGHSRIIRKSYVQEHYSKMMTEAFDIWKKLEVESRTELLVTTGLLYVENEPHTAIKKVANHLQAFQSEFDYLSHEALRERFPMMHYPEKYNGILEPSGGLLKADKCCAVFQNLFQQNGGTIRECCKITKIIPGDIVTIVTVDSCIKAKRIIIAAGPWTNDLLGPLHLRLPLTPMKINVCYWKADDSVYSAESGFPCLIESSFNKHLYALPNLEYPGMLKVCYHFGNEHHPDQRDSEDDTMGIAIVGQYLKDYFVGVADKPSIVEKCFYTWTPDEDFILDSHPVHKNIIIGAGFSGHGFKLAPITGKVLSQLALNIKPDYDLSPFAISRFRKKSSL